MTAPRSPLQLEDLLARSSWIGPLARRLLPDADEADDIVQETCLAFLRRPPRSVETSGGWVGRVVRNLVARSRQARARREDRERRAARPERISVTPDELLHQAEVHRLLVGEVLRLDEPYRSTVLLKFFGERTPAEIARQQEVPVDTVKTRLRRAIGLLRIRLDRRYGSRDAWTLAILPLVGGMGALSTATAGVSTATACAMGSGATGGTSSAAAITSSLLGGIIVAQKTAFTLGIVGIITLAGGFALGRLASKPSAEEFGTRPGLRTAEEARARLEKTEELRKETEMLAAAKASLQDETSGLEKKASELGAKVEELEAKSASVEKPLAGRGPRLTFHDMGELEEDLVGANWREMAEAAAELTSRLEAMHASDTEPDRDQMIEFRLQEQKLIPLSLKMENKLPSHIDDGNGGSTHPIIHWNLLAERLELAGLPLSDAQVRRISRLGVEYDAAWDRQDAGHGTDTLALEKVLDELELKRAFIERLLGLLTREQRGVIVDPTLHDTYPYDLYSPLLLLAGKVEPLVASSRDEIRKSVEKVFIDRFELSEEQSRAAAGAFDAWLEQVEPLIAAPLTSRAPHRVYFFTGVEALAAGRAQTSLMKEVLASLPPDAAARGKILTTNRLHLPRLLEKK